MSKGEEFTSIFKAFQTLPEVMFYIPAVSGPYSQSEMILFIGKAGGGTLGKTYTGERWYGEVRQYPKGIGLGEYEILHSSDFYIGHTANHLKAAWEYAMLLVEGCDSYATWHDRLDYWAGTAFDLEED